jgi:hypothetical protein
LVKTTAQIKTTNTPTTLVGSEMANQKWLKNYNLADKY